eukprot:m.224085 g.224085  ORF g.224085 m.224085 type:complete len:75 (-) comp15146_c0_seq6:181-405(-)
MEELVVICSVKSFLDILCAVVNDRLLASHHIPKNDYFVDIVTQLNLGAWLLEVAALYNEASICGCDCSRSILVH